MATFLHENGTQEPAPISSDSSYLGHKFEHHDRAWLGEWTVARIRQHRDAHQEGLVWAGKRLARFFNRDANVVGALGQRVAPWLGCPYELKDGSDSARAELLPLLSPVGNMLSTDLLREIAEDLVMCGLAITQTTIKPRADGSRWDFQVSIWDLEYVDTDYNGKLVAITKEGRIPINHGDGKWTVFRQIKTHPYEKGAVIPLGFNVASRGHTIVDKANGIQAVGHPKLHAILPEKIAVTSPVGKDLFKAVSELWNGVRHIVTEANTKLEKVEFTGQGWQIFGESLKLDKSDIFLALTGQDGSAANEGGSYAKAYILQGILFAWVVADTQAGGSAYTQGILRPWTIVNRGNEAETPTLKWPLPDPEENERLAAFAKRHQDYAAIEAAHAKNGRSFTEEFTQELAQDMRIKVPKLTKTSVDQGA